MKKIIPDLDDHEPQQHNQHTVTGNTPGWAGLAAPSSSYIGNSSGGYTGSVEYRCVSRRSSVISTNSSFFDRSFFTTPDSRVVDLSKKTTLSYATLMLNLYNNISLDLRSVVDSNRRVVVQSVASKTKLAQLQPTLSRVQADVDDAIDTVAAINQTSEFASIQELLRHSLQVYDKIEDTKAH